MSEQPVTYGDTQMRSLSQILEATLTHWRFVAGASFSAAAITAIVVLLLTPRFTAVGRFITDAPSRPGIEGAMGGIAAQASALLGGGAAGQSPLYYAAILRSRSVLTSVVEDKFAAEPPRADSATLIELWEAKGDSPAQRLDNAIARLSKRMDVAVDRQAGLVSVAVEDESPARAAAIANRLVILVDRFNQERRRSRASRRRNFVDSRATEALGALAASEDGLRAFEDRNRTWRNSAALTLDHDRLARQIQVNQEVYMTLRRELETARIDEVNDVPVLTVVDPAEAPVHKSFPQRTTSVVTVFLMAFAGAVLIVAALTPGARIPSWISAWDRILPSVGPRPK